MSDGQQHMAVAYEERLSIERPQVEELRERMAGEVVGVGDPQYDEARRVWNGMIDKHPCLIVKCAVEQDAVRSIAFAREHGLTASVRGGGHDLAGHAIAEAGLVIDMSRMRQVDVDASTARVRAQAGATLGDVDRETQHYSLAVPAGIVSGTGIAGLTLGGGYGWLSRHFGLAADNLVAVELVTADGRRLRASRDENAHLFWALRGGSGGFCVVTTFEYQAHAVGPKVWVARMAYAADSGPALLRFVRQLHRKAPDELGLRVSFGNAADDSDLPPHVHGVPCVSLFACASTRLDKGEEMTAMLRSFDAPLADRSAPMRYEVVQTLKDASYPEGRFYHWRCLYLRELTDGVIETIVKASQQRPSPLSSVEICMLGGAVRRVPAHTTPIAHRNESWRVIMQANWDNPAQTEVNIAWAREAFTALLAYSSGGADIDYAPSEQEHSDRLRRMYRHNTARLAHLRKVFDPDGIFG